MGIPIENERQILRFAYDGNYENAIKLMVMELNNQNERLKVLQDKNTQLKEELNALKLQRGI